MRLGWSHYYRALTKLREGNVFTHVCLSTGGECIPACTWTGVYPFLIRPLSTPTPVHTPSPPPVHTYPFLSTRPPHNQRRPPQQAVLILLKCILVFLFIFILNNYYEPVRRSRFQKTITIAVLVLTVSVFSYDILDVVIHYCSFSRNN